MKQRSTVELYSYWSKLYTKHGIPERGLIEPSALRKTLGDTFVLQSGDLDYATYRLAGTRLCSIYASELKGHEFAAPWIQLERNTVSNVVRSVGYDQVAAVFGSNAKTKSGRTLSLETLVLPLLHNGQKNQRLLGVTSPVTRPYWLGVDPIISQSISSLRIVDPKQDTSPFNTRFTLMKAKVQPSAVRIPQGKRVGHLTVLEGGKSGFREDPGEII